MAVHVQCNNCGAWAITENHADPDSAVQCVSEAGDPPGSQAGTCCTAGHTHEEHADYARQRNDDGSLCRPVTITIMGSDHGRPGGGVALKGTS